MHPLLEPREDVWVYLDFFLTGPMVDATFGVDMVDLLTEAGLLVASAKDQELTDFSGVPSFLMALTVDRPIDALIEVVRKHTPRGVLLDFEVTVEWKKHDGGRDAQHIPANTEPMAGLL